MVGGTAGLHLFCSPSVLQDCEAAGLHSSPHGTCCHSHFACYCPAVHTRHPALTIPLLVDATSALQAGPWSAWPEITSSAWIKVLRWHHLIEWFHLTIGAAALQAWCWTAWPALQCRVQGILVRPGHLPHLPCKPPQRCRYDLGAPGWQRLQQGLCEEDVPRHPLRARNAVLHLLRAGHRAEAAGLPPLRHAPVQRHGHRCAQPLTDMHSGMCGHSRSQQFSSMCLFKVMDPGRVGHACSLVGTARHAHEHISGMPVHEPSVLGHCFEYGRLPAMLSGHPSRCCCCSTYGS